MSRTQPLLVWRYRSGSLLSRRPESQLWNPNRPGVPTWHYHSYSRYSLPILPSNLCTLFRAIFQANLVLPWRVNFSTVSFSPHAFTGKGDIEMIIFYFENVATRSKDGSMKALNHLAHIDGNALAFFFVKFNLNGAIIEARKNYAVVKTAFLEKYSHCPKL